MYVRPFSSRDAGVFVRELGKGRVVYFPWDIDRTFWEVLDADHGKLLQNAVVWAHNEPQPVTFEGKGMFDVAVWTQKNSMTVHLVNLNNPMTMKGPVREIIPSPPQTVSVAIPRGRSADKVHLLVAERMVPVKHVANRLEIEVPPVGVNEIVAIDFVGGA